jgi:hypothetical protein
MVDLLMSWYRNTSFWSLLVAGSAVVLSQLPPIATWLPSPSLAVYVSDRMGINNAIGVIGFNINVQLTNTGNTDLQIKKMELVLRDSAGVVQSKPAMNYNRLTAAANPIALPINTINVPTASTWSHNVFFNKPIGTSDEAEFLRVRQAVMKSMLDQEVANDQAFEIPSVYTEAEPSVVQQALDFFNAMFDLQQGQYRATLSVHVEQRDEPFSQSFSFTIFPHHINMLRSQTEDYKYGAGILPSRPSHPTKQVGVQLETVEGQVSS